jgi:hypothetical protein
MALDMGMAMATAGPAEATADEAPETRGGASSLRRCLVTRESLPKSAMVRFVVGPDREVVPDVDGKLPGHGFWIKADRVLLEQACHRNLFAKAARQSVVVPPDLPATVESLLARRCLELIGLARGAGAAVAGFEKCRAWLQSGKAGLLLAACDGAADGRAKLRALAGALPAVELFSSAELSRALGRDNAVHGAVAAGGFTAKLSMEAARLAGVRRPDGVQDR